MKIWKKDVDTEQTDKCLAKKGGGDGNSTVSKFDVSPPSTIPTCGQILESIIIGIARHKQTAQLKRKKIYVGNFHKCKK